MITVRGLLIGAALYLVPFPVTAAPMDTAHVGIQGAPQPPHVAQFFGAPPNNCPTADPTLIHKGRGNSPITWVGRGALLVYSSWLVVGHRLVLGFGLRTKYGWPQKVFWQLTRGSQSPVRLRGWNLRSGSRVWFGRPLATSSSPSSAVPPVVAWPSALIVGHRAPTLTLVPSAGCYMLQANWRGGSWSLPFTAGG